VPTQGRPALQSGQGVSVNGSHAIGATSAAPRFSERFTNARLVNRRWKHWWGTSAIRGGSVLLGSTSPVRASETHSSLLTTDRGWRDFTLDFDVSLVRQLRRHDPPNPWETGWVLFRFRDLSNYYDFLVKPNGWELGKKQGSDTQIFLASGDSPTLPIGAAARVRIAVNGARIRVAVNGRRVVDFVDPHPLRAGSIGLYEEDALARFGALTVTAGP
jgi:hypothetical protein